MSWGPTRGQHTWSRRGPYDNTKYDSTDDEEWQHTCDDDNWGHWRSESSDRHDQSWWGSTWNHDWNQSWDDHDWNWNDQSWAHGSDHLGDTNAAARAPVVSTDVDLEQEDSGTSAAPEANQPCDAKPSKYSLVEHVKSMAAKADKHNYQKPKQPGGKKTWEKPYVPGLVDPVNPKFMDEPAASNPKAANISKTSWKPCVIEKINSKPPADLSFKDVPCEEEMTDLDKILWQRP